MSTPHRELPTNGFYSEGASAKDGLERTGPVTWTQIYEQRRRLKRDLWLDRLRKQIRDAE